MINLTIAAHNKIKNSIPKNHHFRIGILAGGCSGYSYNLSFVPAEDKKDDDLVVGFSTFKMLVDPKSLDFLVGTIIDYKENDFGASFTFNNPNATRCCGCGESFC